MEDIKKGGKSMEILCYSGFGAVNFLDQRDRITISNPPKLLYPQSARGTITNKEPSRIPSRNAEGLDTQWVRNTTGCQSSGW